MMQAQAGLPAILQQEANEKVQANLSKTLKNKIAEMYYTASDKKQFDHSDEMVETNYNVP